MSKDLISLDELMKLGQDAMDNAGNKHRPSMQEKDLQVATYQMPIHLKDSMQGKQYSILTYGCQMNEHDSEIMAGLLQEMGYTQASDVDEADFILFNTCAVRENAESKVWGEVGRLKPLKRLNPGMIIGICGCMAQEEPVRQRIQAKYPQVDIVFGTHNVHRLPELIEQAQQTKEAIFEVWEEAQPVLVENMPKARMEGTKAWVNIHYGCNKFCTYCIVPYTRGRERSRIPSDVVAEVEELAKTGFREITLLGQNVNDYGLDLKTVDFADLLEQVNRVDGIDRIRFTTSNPWNFTDKLIDTIAHSKNVCEHIHLPVQSGNNDVLKRMNRSHTREYYMELVDKIRSSIPDVALTTDIIVGFPGETEEQFLDTLDLLQRIRYDGAYTFIYSPRKGTPAAKWEDNITMEVKKDRLNRLMELQNQISLEKNLRLQGKVVEVLVEGVSKTNPDMLSGRTRTNKLVHFKGSEKRIGQLVMVEIADVQTWTLKGSLLEVKDAAPNR
ncbi:tRNA (N6-isopentenyl adenosine(37)-C2)-methylthiotransferase MiaB [Fodinisporobacter ferrooxydans]|uniref:tRNA-2-methylthio-N(6)-dimethylallyladenosine synthase n=1 Tax=Fodinisporobacter ferrooxydans TaxID=2901836 RepID=A0ABY4CJ12_9BACL|nr:tRNA (N6-isopentenyl adenosine(37)-C2)-methylthiotransferase MiaB [Alicyclobacillaceae bacterium MYW30-H2]